MNQLTIFNDRVPKATEALFREFLPGVGVVEACDLSLLGARWIYKAFRELHLRKGKRLRECIEVGGVEVLNPHVKHLLCWRMPLRCQNCKMHWEHRLLTCVERSCVSSAGRASEITLPSFLASWSLWTNWCNIFFLEITERTLTS